MGKQLRKSKSAFRLLRGKWRFFAAASLVLQLDAQSAGGGSSRLHGHFSHRHASARHLGRKPAADRVPLTFALRPRHADDLARFLTRIQDPSDPFYQHYLSSEQFTDLFGPSDADVKKVTDYLTASGLRVTNVHGNRLVINAEGSAAAVENAFQVELGEFAAGDGRVVHAPSDDPLVDNEVAKRLTFIGGLDSFAARRTHLHAHALAPAAVSGYLSPTNIKKAYSLDRVTATGAGETIALFELDGYRATDIAAYATHYGIIMPQLQNVLVDGYNGASGSGADEVTLDIELAIALAPGVAKVMVYEGPNTDAGVLDTYNRIATDNLAKTVSTSWGLSENETPAAALQAENTIFQQMAAQGQSIFAASGDSGAYDDSSLPTTLEVDDPASQPYVTGVGGTTLTIDGTGAYVSESSWGVPSTGDGGGGGVSRFWPAPSWQTAFGVGANTGAGMMRQVPDVALDASPDGAPYPIYFHGAWYGFGGTSCAAPLWAAYTALVNQTRVANGLARIGFANPAIYQIAQSSLYAGAFHDIADGSTNLHYAATAGYDLSTGWGSFNGAGLFSALTNPVWPPLAPAPSAAPASLSLTVSWAAPAGATSYNLMRSTSSSGPFTTLASGYTGTSYADGGLTYGTTYYYSVQAADSAGTSAVSATVSGSPYPATPGVPPNVTVTVTP